LTACGRTTRCCQSFPMIGERTTHIRYEPVKREEMMEEADDASGQPDSMDAKSLREQVDALYRSDSRRVLATLIRLLRDIDLAEEALHDAFTAALAQWAADGIPVNPRAWLVSTGRFKAIDRIRRRSRFDTAIRNLGTELEIFERGAGNVAESDQLAEAIEDDRLRLIFICCHPALSEDARVALTLREVCGLTTDEIAGAFMVPSSTIAQRIVRAKSKIRDEHIPYEIPSISDLQERLDMVLRVIYLVFNEGYFASSGDSVTRHDLSIEAIRLGRLLVQLLPDSETFGLLALMLLHDSRRQARTTRSGEVIRLEDQDRSLWNRDLIEEGSALVVKSLSSNSVGPYALQAAIVGVHADAKSSDATDWAEIVGLYDMLLRVSPTPVVELNRAVAVAMRDGPAAGLSLVEAILARGELVNYHFTYMAQAELHRRLGRNAEARSAYLKALEIALQEPERRFIQRRIDELSE